MRKRPTPSSLGLTETTCSDMYRAGGKAWFMCKLEDGQVWYTNGYLAMSKRPGSKGCEKFISPYNLGLDLDFAPQEARVYHAEPALLGGEFLANGKVPCIRLLVQCGLSYRVEHVCTIQTKYAELMRWAYPGCKFRAYSTRDFVQVFNTDDKLVGVVAPFMP